MKECSKCKTEKSFNKFSKHKTMYDGLNRVCRDCIRDSNRTQRGLAKVMFNNQVQRSKKRGHNTPEYSRSEFVDYLMNDTNYINLHNEWVESGYDNALVPSADRLDNTKGYSLDNIQIVTWKENDRLGQEEQLKIGNSKNKKSNSDKFRR